MTFLATFRSLALGSLALGSVAPPPPSGRAGARHRPGPRRVSRLSVAAAAMMFLAGPTAAEDLLSIHALALAHDPIIQADELELMAEQQRPRQARGALLPNVNARAARIRRRDELTGSAAFVTQGDATFNVDQFGVELTQSLFDRGKTQTLAQATLRADLAGLRFAIASQDLIIRVARRYFAVLAALDNVDLSVAERKAVARQLELARERLTVGLGTKTDLYDAQARFALAQAEEIRSRNVLDDARQALAELIGLSPPPLSKLKPDAPLLTPHPDDLSYWVARAMAGNLDLQIANRNMDIAKRELGRQQAGFFPTLDLVVRYNLTESDGSISGPGVDSETTDALVQLNVPIFQGGIVRSRTSEARLRFEAEQQRSESARRLAERNTRAAFLDVTTSIRQTKALAQAVTASESALEARQEGFEAGLNTNLDVLDAQRDLFRAKRDYLRARYDYILSYLRLRQVVGELSRAELEEVNSWLG